MKLPITIFLTSILFSQNTFAVISIQTMRPSMSSASYVLTENAVLSSELVGLSWNATDFFMTMQFNSVDSPLVQKDASGKRKKLIDRASSIDFGFVFKASDRLLFGTDFGASTVKFSSGSTDVGLNDARVTGKYVFFERKSRTGAAIVPELYFPTGNRSAYLSNDSYGFGALLSAEQQFKSFRVAANLGFRRFTNAILKNIDYSDQIPVGLGTQLALGQKFALNLEGQVSFLPRENFKGGPGDVYFGGQLNIFHGGLLYAGMGIGNLSTADSPSYRVVAGLKMFPFRIPEKEPASAPKTKVITQVEKTVLACGVEPFTVRFNARPLKKKEMAELPELPYLSTTSHPIKTLQIGQMTGISNNGIPYVIDSQILFAIDIIALPARNTLTSTEDITLKVDVQKTSKHRHNDSEIVCFLDEKLCSGELFDDPDKKTNINAAFFHGKETPNDYFITQFLKNQVSTVGDLKIYASQLSLDLNSLTQNTVKKDPLDLIYGNSDPSLPLKKRTLLFAIAANTFVGANTFLDIVLKHNTCETIRVPKSTGKENKKSKSKRKKNEVIDAD